jgi:hypothetical protein
MSGSNDRKPGKNFTDEFADVLEATFGSTEVGLLIIVVVILLALTAASGVDIFQ